MSLLTRTDPRLHPATADDRSGRPTRPERRRTADAAAAPSPERPPHRELVRRELAAYAQRVRLGDLVRIRP